LASGSEDRHAKVWSVSQGDLIRDVTLDFPQEWALSVALSSNGSLLGTGGDNGQARVWTIADGRQLWIGGPDNQLVYSVCFSPDDSLLGIGRSDRINVRSTQTGNGISVSDPEGAVSAVCFSPNGQLFASANADHDASLWHVPDGAFVRRFIGHSNVLMSVDFSPDGSVLATASADGTARLWNVADGTPLRVIAGAGGMAKFSADGRLLFSLNNGTFTLWRVANGAYVGSLTNTGALAFDVARNGKYFAYGTGAGAVVLARTPLVISEIARSGHEAVLRWSGGSGLYQLQRATNLVNGLWENAATPSSATAATNAISGTVFYRVQSLPNP
jgi:WD40 repeat protein